MKWNLEKQNSEKIKYSHRGGKIKLKIIYGKSLQIISQALSDVWNLYEKNLNWTLMLLKIKEGWI